MPALYCVWGKNGNNLQRLKTSEQQLAGQITLHHLHCAGYTPGNTHLASDEDYPAFTNPHVLLPNGVSQTTIHRYDIDKDVAGEYFTSNTSLYPQLNGLLTDDNPLFSQIKFYTDIQDSGITDLKVITVITDKDVRSTAMII